MIKQMSEPDNALYPFAEALRLTAARLDGVLSQSPPVIRPYTAYLAETKGKMLRAQSVLICAQNQDQQIPPVAIVFAAAVELVHLATLVHDDVMDQADLRRGKPTLRAAHGNKTAVICGDYLLSQGVRLAASVRDPANLRDIGFPDYLSEVCLGELNQYLNNNNFQLTPLRYFRIIKGKTAALFEASFLAGAVAGGEPAEFWSLYRRLGHYIGMIYQLIDDCLDFESDTAYTGKSVQSDYEQNVITLPLIFTLKSDPALRDQIISAHAAGRKLPRPAINQAVRSRQGLAQTRLVAARYGEKARSVLRQIPASESKRNDLQVLLARALHQS
ncbi:MAG TPA: polyprenyl synthetase family protein [Clostridiales bacterium]|nr:polyprenyl synthetase family protein [Clostridiales bacterium]